MSYAQFLLLFLCMPLAACVVRLRGIERRVLLILAVISGVAILYTGPWDSAIIKNGVWSYGRGQVIGLLVGGVPVEEYIFYVLQVFLTGSLTLLVLRRRSG